MSFHYIFDQEAKDRFDDSAKSAVSGWLTARGYSVRESGLFDLDLSVSKGGEWRANVECEVRQNWRTDDWPYDTIQCSYRKAKFCAESGHWLAIVNGSYSAFVLVPLTSDYSITQKCVDVRRGSEKFLNFPASDSFCYKLGD